MTPEEHQLQEKIFELVIEIKSAFDKLAADKRQKWKDELARRRERCW